VTQFHFKALSIWEKFQVDPLKTRYEFVYFLSLPSMRRILSCFILSFWLFANIPHEILHEFTNHEDTIDPSSYSCAILTLPHIHCLILQLQLDHFTSAPACTIPSGIEWQQKLYSVIIAPVITPEIIYSSARAPPVSA